MSDGERVLELMVDGVQAFGDELLLVDAFTASEAISTPFSCHLDLVSEHPEQIADKLPDLLGSKATLAIGPVTGERRYINGYIYRFSQTGQDARYTRYEVELVSWLAYLGLRRNCRIFQFADVKEILNDLFDEWLKRLGDAKFSVKNLTDGPFVARDYCVQYRESDLDFVSRLMEEEGICYFFEQAEDHHVLVLADDPSHHEEYQLDHAIRFDLSGDRPTNAITSWTLESELASGSIAMRDHHFERPGNSEDQSEVSLAPRSPADFEAYDYPGGFAKRFVGKQKQGSDRLKELPDLGGRQAVLGMEEVEAPLLMAHGASVCPDLLAGHRFKVEVRPGDFASDYYEAMDGVYLVVSVQHQGSGGGYTGSGSFSYSNSFEALPQKVAYVEEKFGFRQPIPFRPPRVTPRPEMRGPQTAVVVGPQQEEIHTDKYGRVKVQFFWDRRDKYSEESSCWVRVAQPWAGKRWGASFIPRIGQEVLVDFVDGDPDRPVITGSLYNAEQMPPYLGDGPDDNHKDDPKLSGIKTASTPDAKGFNELRFDDTKGKEQVFIHAQRSMDQRVRGSHRHTVGGSYHLNIGYEDSEGEKHGDLRSRVKGNHHHHVETNQRVRIDGSRSLEVRGDVDQLFWTYLAEAIQDEWTVECPTIVFKATNAICFEVGGSKVVIDSNGVSVNGTGAAGVAIEGTPTVKINCATPIIGPVTQHGPPSVEDPEEPSGADTAKSGFVSNPRKGGG